MRTRWLGVFIFTKESVEMSVFWNFYTWIEKTSEIVTKWSTPVRIIIVLIEYLINIPPSPVSIES